MRSPAHDVRPYARKVPKGLLLRSEFVGAEVPPYFKYICKLYRFMVSQKKEYTGCTELTAVQYSYSIFFNTGVYNITHYC